MNSNNINNKIHKKRAHIQKCSLQTLGNNAQLLPSSHFSDDLSWYE